VSQFLAPLYEVHCPSEEFLCSVYIEFQLLVSIDASFVLIHAEHNVAWYVVALHTHTYSCTLSSINKLL